MCFKIISKVAKNRGITLSLEDTFPDKLQGGGGGGGAKFAPPPLLHTHTHTQILTAALGLNLRSYNYINYVNYITSVSVQHFVGFSTFCLLLSLNCLFLTIPLFYVRVCSIILQAFWGAAN